MALVQIAMMKKVRIRVRNNMSKVILPCDNCVHVFACNHTAERLLLLFEATIQEQGKDNIEINYESCDQTPYCKFYEKVKQDNE